MIKLSHVSLLRGRKMLLEDASMQVFPGHKVALIGSNGCGKSTLFALLRGELAVDAGDCSVPGDWRIVSVAQETPASDRTALEYVIDGDKHLRALQHELSGAHDNEDGVLIGQLHGQLEQAGAYDVEARAAMILAGLGFTNNQLTAPVTDFSGGWRMRLNLAQALLCPSDLLLLDEPTEGIAPALTKRIIEILNNLKKQGVTTLVAESNEKHYEKMLDRTFTIERGEIKTKYKIP